MVNLVVIDTDKRYERQGEIVDFFADPSLRSTAHFDGDHPLIGLFDEKNRLFAWVNTYEVGDDMLWPWACVTA